MREKVNGIGMEEEEERLEEKERERREIRVPWQVLLLGALCYVAGLFLSSPFHIEGYPLRLLKNYSWMVPAENGPGRLFEMDLARARRP